MIRNIVFLSLFCISSLLARVDCYDLDEYQDENGRIANLAEIRDLIKRRVENKGYNQCVSDGGAGSTFSIDDPLYVKTCEGLSGAKNGYIKIIVGCNYCTGKKISDRLKSLEEECDNACMVSNAHCKEPSIDAFSDDGWGGEIENDGECGETLPECQSDESSSSQGEESSSSESASSSSQENSSSSQVNSSSSQEEYISSDETVSDDSDSSGYAGGGSKGFDCEGFTVFQKRPKMIDKIELREFKPFCSSDGYIVMAANIPYLDIAAKYECSDIVYD